MIASDDVDAGTRLVLANAVHFKGSWNSPFEASATKDQPFTLGDKSTTRVPLMRQLGRLVDPR